VCQARTLAEKTCLTGATALAPGNQRRYELFVVLSLPIPCLREHSRRGAVEKKGVSRGQSEKEKERTCHSPMTLLSRSTTARYFLRSAARHHGNMFV